MNLPLAFGDGRCASFKEDHPAVNLCGVKAPIPRGGSPLKQQHAEHVRLITCLAFGFSLVLLFACLTISAQAVSPITPSGLNTQVSPPSTLPSGKVQYDITGGTRPGGGTNLFHSFGDFNVPNNNISNFLVLQRPTCSAASGENLSSISGMI